MRKIVQIALAATPETRDGCEARVLFALCDDGTVWAINLLGVYPRPWKRLEPIPQDEE